MCSFVISRMKFEDLLGGLITRRGERGNAVALQVGVSGSAASICRAELTVT